MISFVEGHVTTLSLCSYRRLHLISSHMYLCYTWKAWLGAWDITYLEGSDW